ncbi:hypothetical protein [Fervidibacter sp.]
MTSLKVFIGSHHPWSPLSFVAQILMQVDACRYYGRADDLVGDFLTYFTAAVAPN